MKYIDLDGQEIIGTDGKPVTYQPVNGHTIKTIVGQKQQLSGDAGENSK